MALTSEDIYLGSGSLYLVAVPESFPTAATIDTYTVEANRLGHVKDGATVSYNPSYYEAKDDLGIVSKTIITDEEVVFKSGIMTWDGNSLAKLTQTGSHPAGTEQAPTPAFDYDLGGMENYSEKQYLLIFKHMDGIHYAFMVCSPNGGFEIGFKKDAETVIDSQFKAQPMPATWSAVKGRLLTLREFS